MTDREIQEKLLAYYIENLAAMPIDSLTNARLFLLSKNMLAGICACSWVVFDVELDCQGWVAKYCNKNSHYWGYTPWDSRDVQEIIMSLSHRISTLEKILAQ